MGAKKLKEQYDEDLDLQSDLTELENDDSKIDYHALEVQRTEQLKAQLKAELRSRQAGRIHSLRRSALALVVEGEYEEASGIVDVYVELKAELPAVAGRTVGHVRHAKELINAIRAKREFPNLSQLAMSKQQEILDHAVSHFEELKITLRAIEQIVRDEVVKDIRSSVWVIRSLCYVIGAITLIAFVSDFPDMLARPFVEVVSYSLDRAFELIVRFLPFL